MHAVIFDIDGTLIESAAVDDELYRQSVIAVLGPVRFRDTLNDYDHVTDSGILAQLLEDNDLRGIPDPTAAIQSQFVDSLQRHTAQHGPFSEIPGARAFVASLLCSNHHSVAIATGGWRPSALLKLRSAGFEFDGVPIATSDDDRRRSQIMLTAFSQLDGEFETVQYFGDGVWDRDACHELGWDFQPVGQAVSGLKSYAALETRLNR